MAISKSVQRLLVGVSVKTKKAMQWHDLRIPAGTIGRITSVSGRFGGSAMVKFDDGRKYGSFEFYLRELGPA